MTLVREFIAQYSTQVFASSNAYPTISDLLTEIAGDIATTQTDVWRLGKISDYLALNWEGMASTCYHTTTLSSGQSVYALTTDMRFENIKQVLVSDSSQRTTTALWTGYSLAGEDDVLESQTYFKAGHGIGLYPVPTSDEHKDYLTIVYAQQAPHYTSTSDSTTVLAFPERWLLGAKQYVKSEIAKSGDAPDVALANNHEGDMEATLGKMRMAKYKRDAKHPKEKWDYRKGYYKG